MPPNEAAAAVTDVYRSRLARLNDATTRTIVHRLDLVGIADGAAVDQWADDTAVVVESAQHHAVVMTSAYLDEYLGAAGITPATTPANSGRYAGTLRQKPLQAALRSVPAAAYWMLGRGSGLDAAHAYGVDTAIRISRTAVNDAARDVLADRMTAEPLVVGWRRVSSGHACPECIALSGHRMSDSHPFESHDRCGCTAEPVLGHQPERVLRPRGAPTDGAPPISL